MPTNINFPDVDIRAVETVIESISVDTQEDLDAAIVYLNDLKAKKVP